MITYRNANLAELKEILNWAAEEGWNPGLADAEAFYAADPKGFFVAVDDTGAMIAAISVVNHTVNFAFLGLYIVRPDKRGQGIGLGLWHHAMRHAGTRVVGLDGVEAQQDNYIASGFAPAGGTVRFCGSVAPDISPDISPDIRLARAKDRAELILSEARASGVEKPAYLQAWFAQDVDRTTLISEANGNISGFCTVRKCRDGAKIGPLHAHDIETAEMLIRKAASKFEGEVTLDVPEASQELGQLCAQLGLIPGFKTARMYRGTFDQAPPGLFAVTSLELG